MFNTLVSESSPPVTFQIPFIIALKVVSVAVISAFWLNVPLALFVNTLTVKSSSKFTVPLFVIVSTLCEPVLICNVPSAFTVISWSAANTFAKVVVNVPSFTIVPSSKSIFPTAPFNVKLPFPSLTKFPAPWILPL